MVNKEKLHKSLASYKEIFEDRWQDEKYKWEAVKWFQDHWDINAENFSEMFAVATEKTNNLLTSLNNFPRGMLRQYAEWDSERVREMFADLFDERKPITDRVLRFQEVAQELCAKYTPGKQHYQRPMAITVYLWLKYPDKYDVYKFTVYKGTAKFLECAFVPKMGDTVSNINGSMKLISEIQEVIRLDEELISMFRNKLDENCYPDQSLRTLAFDVSFYIANFLNENASTPKKKRVRVKTYNPKITKEQWVELFNDETVFNKQSREIVCRIRDYGGQATCVQLATKYGESVNFYNAGSTALAKRIAEKTGCELFVDSEGKTRYWPVLYVGRDAGKNEDGSFVWKLRDELVQALEEMDLSGVELYVNNTTVESYTKEQFLSEVYMNEDRYETLKALLLKKQNIILQGAPGVGKTFTAKKLAYSIMGVKDDNRVEFIQFHQNYSYEDFIMGYKPSGEGFELKNGIFYRFCMKAIDNPEESYFFIIDEINRGNMSKIFGELLMLIEKDYRGTKATLAYNGLPFEVPENIYIIGMMNTADRSLAMIDYALRRRFSFYVMEPGFETEGFKQYEELLNDDTFGALIDAVIELNRAITEDSSLGKGFCIGHSYFCGQQKVDEEELLGWMTSVVDYDIMPMLEEYWFDEPEKVRRWRNRLQGVFNS